MLTQEKEKQIKKQKENCKMLLMKRKRRKRVDDSSRMNWRRQVPNWRPSGYDSYHVPPGIGMIW